MAPPGRRGCFYFIKPASTRLTTNPTRPREDGKMKRFRNCVLLALGLATAVAALTLSGSLTGYTGQSPPTFNVNVSNTPLPVNVANWPTQPVPVQPVKEPFSSFLDVVVADGQTSWQGSLSFASDKMAVIEFISFEAPFPVSAHVFTSPSSLLIPTGIFLLPPTEVPGVAFYGSQQVTLYATPDGEGNNWATFNVTRAGSSGTFHNLFRVSGHYEPLP